MPRSAPRSIPFRRVRRFTTIELKVNYFRRSRKVGWSDRLVRVGSTICVGQVDLADQKRRSVGIAIVTTCSLMRASAPKASDRSPIRPQ